MSLSKVEILILDEADRMLDMGFLPDIKQIVQILPEERQNLMFSATFSGEIKKLANKILKKPVLIEVAKQNSVSEMITHVVHPIESCRKQELLIFLIEQKELQQVLIFTRTKQGADRLAQYLNRHNISSAALHGDRNQLQRSQALESFKNGLTRVLVATDVAARGLDIDELSYVINFELPNTAEDYIHRIGRTGRAGTKGVAISLVCQEESKLLAGIEKLLKAKIKIEEISEFEATKQQLQSVKSNALIEEKKIKRTNSSSNRIKQPSLIKQNKAATVDFKNEVITKKNHHMEKSEDPLFTQPYISKFSHVQANQTEN